MIITETVADIVHKVDIRYTFGTHTHLVSEHHVAPSTNQILQ